MAAGRDSVEKSFIPKAHTSEARPLEIIFLDVGQGDGAAESFFYTPFQIRMSVSGEACDCPCGTPRTCVLHGDFRAAPPILAVPRVNMMRSGNPAKLPVACCLRRAPSSLRAGAPPRIIGSTAKT